MDKSWHADSAVLLVDVGDEVSRAFDGGRGWYGDGFHLSFVGVLKREEVGLSSGHASDRC